MEHILYQRGNLLSNIALFVSGSHGYSLSQCKVSFTNRMVGKNNKQLYTTLQSIANCHQGKISMYVLYRYISIDMHASCLGSSTLQFLLHTTTFDTRSLPTNERNISTLTYHAVGDYLSTRFIHHLLQYIRWYGFLT